MKNSYTYFKCVGENLSALNLASMIIFFGVEIELLWCDRTFFTYFDKF